MLKTTGFCFKKNTFFPMNSISKEVKVCLDIQNRLKKTPLVT